MPIQAFEPAALVPVGEFRADFSAVRDAVPAITTGAAFPGLSTTTTAVDGASPDFAATLRQAIDRVNGLLHHADIQAERVATGDAVHLHDAMIAMAEAEIAMQITMTVVKKALAAYQEISHMQV